MRVLVTGANGFVGAALCPALLANGLNVSGVVRSTAKAAELPADVQPIVVDSLDDLAKQGTSLGRFDAVVHLAARVHQMRETAADPLAAFREVNATATANLARWAARQGATRFVFLSSIKVNGEGQDLGETPHVYNEQDAAAPVDPYGISKWFAELELQAISEVTGLETVILRPTLIYGPQVRANFRQLLRLANSGIPLPLGRLSNVRSMLYLGNLIEAIQLSLAHPQAAGETFLVSDGDDLTTSTLIQEMISALGASTRLFPFSPGWLDRIGRLTGKGAIMQRLLGTLQVDSSKIRQRLDWKPTFSTVEGLQETASWYRQHAKAARHTSRAA